MARVELTQLASNVSSEPQVLRRVRQGRTVDLVTRSLDPVPWGMIGSWYAEGVVPWAAEVLQHVLARGSEGPAIA